MIIDGKIQCISIVVSFNGGITPVYGLLAIIEWRKSNFASFATFLDRINYELKWRKKSLSRIFLSQLNFFSTHTKMNEWSSFGILTKKIQ